MLLIAALLATGEVRAQETAPAPAAPAPAVVIPNPSPAPELTVTDPLADARHHRHAKGDSLEGLNRTLFGFHQRADKALFRPLALFYKAVIPKPLRTALRHILSNLTEPLVFMNDTLQLKPKRAIKTMSRFVINSSVGVGGILDIAKTADLPHHDNSFGNTLARYGVGPGPYFFTPFYGPTDLRDLIAGQLENLIYPLAVGFPFDRSDYQISAGLVAGLDLRAQSDPDFKALLDGAVDPYATLRSVYLQSRAAEIAQVKGETAATALDDPLVDPEPPANDGTPPTANDPTPVPATTDSTAAPPTATPNDATPAPTTVPTDATPEAPAVQTEPADTKTPDPSSVPSALLLHAL